MSRETRILHPPFTSSTSDITSTLYNLWVSGEDADMKILPMDYLSNVAYDFVRNFMIKSSQTIFYKPSPIEEINLGEWKKSLTYDNTQVDNLLRQILLDFGAEDTAENIQWLKKDVAELILLYEKKYDVQLEENMREALQKLAIRMAYDRICLRMTV